MALTMVTPVAVGWAACAISLVFVVLRLYARRFLARKDFMITVADILVVMSWILCVVGNIQEMPIVDILGWQWDGENLHFDSSGVLPDFEKLFPEKKERVKLLKLLYSMIYPYYASIYCIKFSFILLYIKLIPSNLTKLRWFLYTTSVITGLCFILSFGVSLFWCQPISRNWADKPELCMNYASIHVFLLNTGAHLITDILIYIFPFFILPHLKQSLRQRSRRGRRIGLIAVFSLGGITIFCSLGRLVAIFFKARYPHVILWSTAENVTAIIVACMPPLLQLYRRKKCDNFRLPGAGLPPNAIIEEKIISPKKSIFKISDISSCGSNSTYSAGVSTFGGLSVIGESEREGISTSKTYSVDIEAAPANS